MKRATFQVPALVISALLAVALCVTALLPLSTCRLILFACLSGLPLALLTRRRFYLTEVLFLGPAVSLVLWSLATPLAWSCRLPSLLPWWPALLAAGITGGMAAGRRSISFYRFCARDVIALAIAAPLVFLAALVIQANGRMPSGDYVAHSWFALDSQYLFSLVQMAIERQALPRENPMLAHIPNYYRVLVHVGLAGLTIQSGAIAALALPRLTCPVAAAVGCGLVHALTRRIGSLRTRSRQFALGLAIVFFVFARPDLFIFPQTQFFAWLVLALFLWISGPSLTRAGLWRLAASAGLLLFLVASHLVTAFIALSLYCASLAICGFRASRTGRLPEPRLLFAGLTAAVATLYFACSIRMPFSAPPGPATMQSMRDLFSMTLPWASCALVSVLVCVRYLTHSAHDSRKAEALAGVILLLTWAGWCWSSLHKAEWFDGFFLMLNAQRFPHAALLLSIPGVCVWPGPGRWLLLSIMWVWLFLCPSATLKDTPDLVQGPAMTAQKPVLDALKWVRQTTPTNAAFLTLSQDNLLPAFSGRAQIGREPHNLWGMNTISTEELADRSKTRERFLKLTSTEKLSYLQRYCIDYVLVVTAPTDKPTTDKWINMAFPPETVQDVYQTSTVLILAVRPPGR